MKDGDAEARALRPLWLLTTGAALGALCSTLTTVEPPSWLPLLLLTIGFAATIFALCLRTRARYGLWLLAGLALVNSRGLGWFHKYFPGIYKQLLDAFIPVEKLISIFTLNFSAHASVHKFPLPSDLTDMNMHAGWNRPEIYFDYEVRRGISPFALADEAEVQNGLDQLWSDLKSGRWDKKYGYLRKKASYDLGFIFVKFVRTISPSGIAKARRLSHANIASS